ncbi:hypothetical protein SDC9_87682 [bioreactor metagenome]|uniref:Uncharacterized protein n=1 Tax=bioreactor metagenome TaxID=1076179 RepID=A0A644ZQX0_9ZZZZ|nr:hypothetical protein [Candidatus Metalachnospira sp.]
MFISDTDTQKSHILKAGFVYLLVSLFCVIFGAVYEYFSHEVYSYYMLYAFAFPLAGGTLPLYALALGKSKYLPERLAWNLYNAGIAAFTVGSIFKGVLDIYGTTNALVHVYWYLGTTLCGTGFLLYLYGILAFRKKN